MLHPRIDNSPLAGSVAPDRRYFSAGSSTITGSARAAEFPAALESALTLRGAAGDPAQRAKTLGRRSTSSLRVHASTAHHSCPFAGRRSRDVLGSCGQLWAAAGDPKSDRTL